MITKKNIFSQQQQQRLGKLPQQQPLFMSTNNDDGNKKRRRVRRKSPLPPSVDETQKVTTDQQQQISVVDTSSAAAALTTITTEEKKEEESKFSPPGDEDVAIEFKIQDVRDIILAGKENANDSKLTIDNKSSSKEEDEEDDDDDDDEEWEYVDFDDDEDNDEYEYVTEEISDDEYYNNENQNGDNKKKKKQDDALEQLLADARAMRVEEAAEKANKKKGSVDVVNDDDATNFFLPGLKNILPEGVKMESFRETLSTIVTYDFFLVLALLAWFLTGIFASYILKNDFIQIAFNNNFNTIVQPALGILMVGSAAGALTDQDEEVE